MLGVIAVTAVFASAILIAVADMLIKKVALSGNFLSAVVNPQMILICVLYLVQVLLAVYVFINKGDLAIYGNLFIVFYSILMVALGMFVFKEHLSLMQSVGVVFALLGAVLINSRL